MYKLQTLILLMVAYAAATWLPGPGLAARGWTILSLPIRPPEVLLAALLFCAGLCSTPGALTAIMRTRSRFLVLAIAAWLLPLAAVLLTVGVLWGVLNCPPQVALGMIVIASMPVANSSVGWSTMMGGSVTLSIALLIVGTALSPVLTPLAIGAGATTLGTAEQALTQTPWSSGMGVFFLTWVLAPVLLGVIVAGRLGPMSRARLTPIARRCSFVILLILNYLNGAPCLPPLAQQPQLLGWPVLGASSLLLASFVASHLWFAVVGQGFAAPQVQPQHGRAPSNSEKASLMLAVVMRNTGAALVFAGAALPEFVSLSLTIIAYTLLQHLWAGAVMASGTVSHSTSPELVGEVE